LIFITSSDINSSLKRPSLSSTARLLANLLSNRSELKIAKLAQLWTAKPVASTSTKTQQVDLLGKNASMFDMKELET